MAFANKNYNLWLKKKNTFPQSPCITHHILHFYKYFCPFLVL